MKVLQRLNIVTDNLQLYNEAFTHSSYSNEHNNSKNYERLEYLGDAVLELMVSDYLYHNMMQEEGVMTKIRASYVCETALYKYASDLHFEDDIKVGAGDATCQNQTIMADVFEAFIGALYLDKGFDFTKKVIMNIIIPYIVNDYNFLHDYKSQLQELVQTVKQSVCYEIIKETGPSHNKLFTCQVKVDNIVMGEGIGSSKKAAEQEAARKALEKEAKIA